jgi:2',3'-cyclic-nucleotide 2'-phosphodiesterase (5'-nucleotidase family)
MKATRIGITAGNAKSSGGCRGDGGGMCRELELYIDWQQPNLIGQDIRLTFIHTADIHSRLFPITSRQTASNATLVSTR